MKNLYLLTIFFLATVFIGCGSSPSSSGSSSNVNNELYISYSSGITKRVDSVFKTNATTLGTSLVSNSFIPSNISNYSYAYVNNFYEFGDYIYFHQNSKAGGLLPFNTESLYRIHKTTYAYEDLSSYKVYFGVNTFNYLNRVESNGKLYYMHENATTPGLTDLTSFNATGIATSHNIASTNARILSPLILHQNYIYFSGLDNASTRGILYQFDPSVSTVTPIDITGGFDLYANDIYSVGTKIYIYGAPIAGGNNGIWEYDPSTPNIAPSFINNFNTGNEDIVGNFVDGTDLYLSARNNSSTSYNIFKIETANSNTISQLNTMPTTFNNSAKRFVPFNGDIYFTQNNNLISISSPTTVIASNIEQFSLSVILGKLYFSASTIGLGQELYSYDGTTVSLEYDINVGAGDSNPRQISEVNGKIVFQASQDGLTNKLFTLDGSTLTPLN
jgi:ELWxxDGT repeat protein